MSRQAKSQETRGAGQCRTPAERPTRLAQSWAGRMRSAVWYGAKAMSRRRSPSDVGIETDGEFYVGVFVGLLSGASIEFTRGYGVLVVG